MPLLVFAVPLPTIISHELAKWDNHPSPSITIDHHPSPFPIVIIVWRTRQSQHVKLVSPAILPKYENISCYKYQQVMFARSSPRYSKIINQMFTRFSSDFLCQRNLKHDLCAPPPLQVFRCMVTPNWQYPQIPKLLPHAAINKLSKTNLAMHTIVGSDL